ncbi:MAG: hypothetical protein O2819_05405 [Planctomycetota bacterium]|nr:hypothetical protein [Planctomycetota bacterium]MDA1106376.1 hypothetical protein [Planctomycetota bacterium]
MHPIATTATTHFTRVHARPFILAVIIGTLFTLAIAPRVDAGGPRSGAGSSAKAGAGTSRSAADIEAEQKAKSSRTAQSSKRISSAAKGMASLGASRGR